MHDFKPLAAYRYNSELATIATLTSPPPVPRTTELIKDNLPSFYLYSMTFPGERGHKKSVIGVIGMLELSIRDISETSFDIEASSNLSPQHILVHEKTINPDSFTQNSDEGTLIGRPGTGPTWAIQLNNSLDLNKSDGNPLVTVTDPNSVIHHLRQITSRPKIEVISEAVSSSQLVIADGHHRMARAMRALSRSNGTTVKLLCFLTAQKNLQVEIRPIHRCFKTRFDLSAVLEKLSATYHINKLDTAAQGAEGLVLFASQNAYLLTPRNNRTPRIDVLESQAIAKLLEARSTQYITDLNKLKSKVESDPEKIGLSVRPLSMTDIRKAALAKQPLPPKSTLFYPKPLAGLVLGDHINF